MTTLLRKIKILGCSPLFFQGDTQHKQGSPKFYKFYTNGSARRNLFTISMRSIFMHLIVNEIAKILTIPFRYWDHYVTFKWALLDNMASVLTITMKFLYIPNFLQHRHVFMWKISSLHQLTLMWSIRLSHLKRRGTLKRITWMSLLQSCLTLRSRSTYPV